MPSNSGVLRTAAAIRWIRSRRSCALRSAGGASVRTAAALKPAFSTALIRAARSGWAAVTWARSVARFTEAAVTPGTRARTFSTRLTQEAQVMPVMERSMVEAGAAAAFMPDDKGIGVGVGKEATTARARRCNVIA